MLIVTKRRYKKKHVIGGAGLFDTVTNFLKRLATSNAAKTIASKLTSAAQTDLGKKAIEAGKTAAKEIGLHAIDVGKDVAVGKVKALIDMVAKPALTDKSKAILQSIINMGSTAESGSGVGAIAIQDLVKRLNTGAGLRLA